MWKNKTIAEIREALSRSPNQDMIESLQYDPRKGVQNLYQSWLRKEEKRLARHERTRKLYEPITRILNNPYRLVGGIDEAGRGPLAGPVVAACVILPEEPMLDVDDSKKLSSSQREKLFDEIVKESLSYGIGFVSPEEIDELNIYRASKLAMHLAFNACRPDMPDFCYIDAMKMPELGVPFKALIHGDSICASISAASIIAKVTRDRIMIEAAEKYPHYGFESNKGYGAAQHLRALQQHGPCPIHRLSFAPVKDYVLPTFSFFETLIHRSTSAEALHKVGERIQKSSADLTERELSELRELYRKQRNEIS